MMMQKDGRRRCKQTTRWTLEITRLGLVRGVVYVQSSRWWCVWSGYHCLPSLVMFFQGTLAAILLEAMI